MRNKDFKALKKEEKKARLSRVINSKTKGQLSEEEIKRIIDFLNLSVQYNIKVVNCAEEYSKLLTLEYSGWSNLDDYEYQKDDAENIFGEINFGQKGIFEVYNNGNLEEEIISNKDPSFILDQRSAIILKHIEARYTTFGYVVTDNRYDENTFLIIYIPSNPQ